VCWSLTAARESESLRSSSRSSRRSDVRSATPGKTAQGEDKTRSDVRSSTPGKTAQDEDKTRPALASAGRRWPFLAELAPRTGASATTRPGTCLDRSGPCFVRRRGRDSNPGYACAHTGFRDQCRSVERDSPHKGLDQIEDVVVPSGVPGQNSANDSTSATTPGLHPERASCQLLSSLDTDLQSVIASWDGLPAAIRKAIVALAFSQR
jgi:hypothetical protein